MAREGVLPIDEERVVLQGAHIGRPSYLTVAVSGEPGAITGVRVGGRVHLVLRGELFLPD
jgi:predicted PhzF superfamily epimerase YddE/YHI9